MSAAAVTGTVALMLQANRNLDAGQIRRLIRREFPGRECAARLILLNTPGGPRTKAAAIWLSRGNLNCLRVYAASAKKDFRDVLVAAECSYLRQNDIDTVRMPPEQFQIFKARIESDYATWLKA